MTAERTPRQPRKPFQNAGKKEKSPAPDKRRSGRSEQRMDKPYRPKSADERSPRSFVKKERPYPPKEQDDRPKKRARIEKPYSSREEGDRPPKRSFKKERPFQSGEESGRPAKRTFKKERPFRSGEESGRYEKRPFKKERPFHSDDGIKGPVKKIIRKEYPDAPSGQVKKYATRSGQRIKGSKPIPEGIRLNKYIANSGVCSRREADELIKAGVVKVNGQVISVLGSKVMPTDKVQYGDQTLSNEKKRYLLLNKQKGYVTTTKDPHAKNTVMELIAGACKERIYPVGRLDRNTTGLLLFTNDGEMAKKLMHPRSRVIKLYHVFLDQPLSKHDMLKIANGMELEGDRIEVDSIAYVEDAADRREVGMELHSGQNRVVRRIFESLGHKVTKLDRVMYAGLTKRNLPRGKWRFLSEKEVINLMMMR